MGSKYRWFDFADSRNLQGDDATVERLGQRQGITGASSPLPGKPAASPSLSKSKTSSKVMGESRAHTAGEIEAADRNAVGGKRDKCKKGKSCSATCIYHGDDCVVDLDPVLAESLTKLVSHIKGFVDRGGDEEIALNALERFESSGTIEGQAKKVTKALNDIEKTYPDPKEREKRITQVFDLVLPGMAKKGDTGEKQALSEDQVLYLANNKAIEGFEKVYQDVKSGKLKTPEEVNAALRPLAQQRRVNDISDSQIDLAISLMPKDLIASLGKQGSPGEWGKWGANQDTLAVPEGGHTPKNASAAERARLIVRIGMQEGMRDMYTGQKVGFGDIDLEHTIPFGVAKAGAETGSNFGLTTRKNNREKGDISPEEWRQKVLEKYPMEGGNLTEKARQRLQDEQVAAQKYNDEKAKVSGGTSPGTVASVFKGIDDSANKGPVKQKLKNKALQSMAGYGETYLHGFRANRAGASRRMYIYRGSALGEKVMDTAAQVIDKYSQSGDTAKVEKALEILRSASPRIHAILDEKYGPKRLDNEATEGPAISNKVRQEILSELEAL